MDEVRFRNNVEDVILDAIDGVSDKADAINQAVSIMKEIIEDAAEDIYERYSDYDYEVPTYSPA